MPEESVYSILLDILLNFKRISKLRRVGITFKIRILSKRKVRSRFLGKTEIYCIQILVVVNLPHKRCFGVEKIFLINRIYYYYYFRLKPLGISKFRVTLKVFTGKCFQYPKVPSTSHFCPFIWNIVLKNLESSFSVTCKYFQKAKSKENYSIKNNTIFILIC